MSINRKKQFLLISYAFPPIGVVGSLRPYRMCRYLPAKTWTPVVLTVRPRSGIHLDYSLLDKIPTSVAVYRTRNFDPIGIYKKSLSKMSQKNEALKSSGDGTSLVEKKIIFVNPIIRRLIKPLKDTIIGILSTPDHLIFWNIIAIVAGIKILLKYKKIKFIFVTSPPHSSQITGLVLSVLCKKPLIIDYRDPWNDLVRTERSNFRLWFENGLENLIVKKASKVISTSETYSSLLKKRYNYFKNSKFVTITNSFEKDKIESIEPTYSSKFTMSYLGIFYSEHNPYLFFDALKSCIEKYPYIRKNILLKIIGNGDCKTLEYLNKMNLQDIVEITGRLKHDEAIQNAKSSDLLLLLMGKSKKTNRGWIPSKLFEYLAIKKPILAVVPEGDASQIIKKTKSGYVVTSNNINKIENIIRNEYTHKIEKKQGIRFQPDENEINKYSDCYTINKYLELFQKI